MGNFKWEKIRKASNGFVMFTSLVNAWNGGFISTGAISNGTTGYYAIDRYDCNGNIIWEKQYTILNRIFEPIRINMIHNGYLIVGVTPDSLPYPYTHMNVAFIRVDTNGNEFYHKIFDSPKDDLLRDVKIINENRYIFSSQLQAPLILDTVFAKIYMSDSLGNILSSNKFYANQDSVDTHNVNLMSILPLNNGDILFSGQMYLNCVWLMRTDSTLNVTPLTIRNIHYNLPRSIELSQNYPNPFNPSTRIKFDIPLSPLSERGAGGFVVLKIYDILGREVAVLVNNPLQPGKYEVDFDGTNLSSGIYFYQLQSGSFVQTRKMVLIK